MLLFVKGQRHQGKRHDDDCPSDLKCLPKAHTLKVCSLAVALLRWGMLEPLGAGT